MARSKSGIIHLPADWIARLERWVRLYDAGEKDRLADEASRLSAEHRDGMRHVMRDHLMRRQYIRATRKKRGRR